MGHECHDNRMVAIAGDNKRVTTVKKTNNLKQTEKKNTEVLLNFFRAHKVFLECKANKVIG